MGRWYKFWKWKGLCVENTAIRTEGPGEAAWGRARNASWVEARGSQATACQGPHWPAAYFHTAWELKMSLAFWKIIWNTSLCPQIKFYRNTVITFHLCVVSGCFLATKSELSSWDRGLGRAELKIFTILSFDRKCFLLIPGPDTKVIWKITWGVRLQPVLDRETQSWGNGRARNKMPWFLMTTVSPPPPPIKHPSPLWWPVNTGFRKLIFWRDKCILLPFHVENFFFFFNIQTGFLPYILSVESSGPYANQTGCHSVSHFVQFRVLSLKEEELLW